MILILIQLNYSLQQQSNPCENEVCLIILNVYL